MKTAVDVIEEAIKDHKQAVDVIETAIKDRTQVASDIRSWLDRLNAVIDEFVDVLAEIKSLPPTIPVADVEAAIEEQTHMLDSHYGSSDEGQAMKSSHWYCREKLRSLLPAKPEGKESTP